MKIYGVSQSSGVERSLHVESGPDGLVLVIKDLDGNKERARILVDAAELLPALTDPAEGGAEVKGVSPGRGRTTSLRVEVRRNEVWLTAAEGVDVAVGLDDFQDALEGAINRG